MKRTIEIEDGLQDWVNEAIEQVDETLRDYLTQNPDKEELPCLNNDLDYDGTIHQIIDGAVPIYTSKINDAFYLHGNTLEESYDNAGIGDKSEDNWKGIAIYCYIQEKVNEWYDENAQDIFEEIKGEEN